MRVKNQRDVNFVAFLFGFVFFVPPSSIDSGSSPLVYECGHYRGGRPLALATAGVTAVAAAAAAVVVEVEGQAHGAVVRRAGPTA